MLLIRQDTLKALSFIIGRRRKYVPKALSAEVVCGVAATVVVTDVSEMTAVAQLVRELALGERAADQFLTDWSDIGIERDAVCCVCVLLSTE